MDTALKLASELKATSDSFSAVEPVVQAVSKSVNEIRAEAERQNAIERDRIQWQMEIAMLLIASIVLGVGLLIGSSVSKPLKAMTSAMIELTNGNFTIVLPGLGRRDEVATAGTGRGPSR